MTTDSNLEALRAARRVRVIGISGGGKSELTRSLAPLLDLPVIHMDVEFWLPGWVEREDGAWRRKLEELVAQDCWIMDGNYGGSMNITLPPADIIIHVCCTSAVALWGAVSRRFKANWRARSDLAEGCQEQLDPAFLGYVWRFNRDSLPNVEARVAEFGAGKPYIRLKGRRGAKRLIYALTEI